MGEDSSRRPANVKVTLEDVALDWPNFAGRGIKSKTTGKTINKEGDKNFNLVISDPLLAQQMAEDRWGVRLLESSDELADPMWSIRVKLSFKDDLPPDDWRQPKIWYVTGRKKILLDSDSVACIDDAFRDQTIERVDAILSSYWWFDDRPNPEGGEPANIWKISAYVSEMWVTVRQDSLHARYDFDNDQVGDLEDGLPFN